MKNTTKKTAWMETLVVDSDTLKAFEKERYEWSKHEAGTWRVLVVDSETGFPVDEFRSNCRYGYAGLITKVIRNTYDKNGNALGVS